MNAPFSGSTTTTSWQERWQRFSSASVRAFHAYGNWLVGITWRIPEAWAPGGRAPSSRLCCGIRVREYSTMSTMSKLLTALSIGLAAATTTAAVAAQPLAVGAALPAVAQKNQDGQLVQLAAAGAAGYLLVYFYPKANTPGCTSQACSLRDSYATLVEKGVKILGVSSDSVQAQKAFKDKNHLPFNLLADADATVITAFGVPKTLGFAKRQAFLFKDGKLVWRDLAAATDQQAADVLKVLAQPNPA